MPAGNRDGGQWTAEGRSGSGNDNRVLSDENPDELVPGAQYAEQPHGHHTMPQALYKNLPLSPDTKKVFDDAKTGKLHAPGHFNDHAHRQYNAAVHQLFQEYLQKHDLKGKEHLMTPAQARSFVQQILQSRDPRIVGYNAKLMMRELLYRYPGAMRRND